MQRVLQVVGVVLVVVAVLLIVAAGSVYALSEGQLRRVHSGVQGVALTVPTGDAALAEGQRLYITRGCSDCHGADGAGKLFVDDPAIGQLYASNLTRGEGGAAAAYTDVRQWDLAVRHGVARDGRGLLIMPSTEYVLMPDDELAHIVAYIESLPPVDAVYPAPAIGPVGRLLVLAGELPVQPTIIDHDAPRVQVAVAANAEYGLVLATTCTGCHGASYAGQAVPGEATIASNLTPHSTGLGGYDEAAFVRAMREGVRPDGSAIDPAKMPWPSLGQMNDTELAAIWAYLQTVPAVDHNTRAQQGD